MEIPASLRLELEKELRYVSKRLISEEDPARKLFYYSGAHRITKKIVDSSYDPQIVCMDMILEVSCSIITSRFEDISEGSPIPIIDGFFEKLAVAINELADCIGKKQDVFDTLSKIAVLTHVTTGPGYYLYAKGKIEI